MMLRNSSIYYDVHRDIWVERRKVHIIEWSEHLNNNFQFMRRFDTRVSKWREEGGMSLWTVFCSSSANIEHTRTHPAQCHFDIAKKTALEKGEGKRIRRGKISISKQSRGIEERGEQRQRRRQQHPCMCGKVCNLSSNIKPNITQLSILSTPPLHSTQLFAPRLFHPLSYSATLSIL